MVTVQQIRPHHAGFGMFDLGSAVEIEDCVSIADYISYVQCNSECVPVREGDEEYEQIRDVDGRIYNQNGGTILGWLDREGNLSLEVVHVD